MEQRIIFTHKLETDLTQAISECEHESIFVLTDSTTAKLCWPRLADFMALRDSRLITIQSGDIHKNVDSLTHVWKELSDGGATRHSLLINLGGGMVTDLGGFAAATFKRGIDFINVPTTLLAMVDASVGGKTGINFNGLKNEVGVFCDSKFVLLDTSFLSTLDMPNILSGLAEMLKHGLLDKETHWAQLLGFDASNPSLNWLAEMLKKSVAVKERIVEADPHEGGLRKALNLGHTFGHAFESWAAQHKPILHGFAVAFGLIPELYLSCILEGFPTDKMRQTVMFIHDNYGTLPITCDDYDSLIQLMRHDKKNTSAGINFTLLADVGEIRINQTATDAQIREALDFFREGA